ncbi:MAG: alpha-N-acetylglucosaminidase [Spirochaetia bacterium]
MMVDTIRDLIKRQIGEREKEFSFEKIPSDDDFYEIESQRGIIHIRGNTQGNMAVGFYWYLKKYCNAHISWSGNNLTLPEKLPQISHKIVKKSQVDYRYYFNFCTHSYSTAFWDWQRWEKEIDLMAMYGINMPFVVVGQEYLWLRVAKRLGLDEKTILSFLTGPAFSAWNYMGNIDGIGGPLSKHWIREHYLLQLRIIERMRAFGMKVVLPGFYGHVPEGMKKLFPKARITQLSGWFGAEGTWFLEPTDEAYKTVAKIFYEEQTRLYGNDHFYAMDLFHEGNSPDNTEAYLKGTAESVIDTLKQHDSDAVWLMQSWSMNKEIIKAVPYNHLLILDLNAEENPKWEQTQAFYGKPWVWCMLHNYGGRNGMSGDLKAIYKNLNHALTSDANGNLKGIGFAPEAIEGNPVFFELIAERVWDGAQNDLEKWVNNYIERRYGQRHDDIERAWTRLLKSVYSGNNSFGATDSIICARPDFTINKVAVSGVEPYYDLSDIMQAFEMMLDAAEDINGNDAFNYDLVDIGRESLAMAARPIYLEMMDKYAQADKEAFIEFWEFFKEVIIGLNALVGTNRHFLLGNHVEKARAWGQNDEEKSLYGYNVKMQITQWWPTVSFIDYANKHWEGLLTDYYLVRWETFVEHLLNAMGSAGAFDRDCYIAEVESIEETFIENSKKYASETRSDTLEVALSIHHTIYPKLRKLLSSS